MDINDRCCHFVITLAFHPVSIALLVAVEVRGFTHGVFHRQCGGLVLGSSLDRPRKKWRQGRCSWDSKVSLLLVAAVVTVGDEKVCI